VFKDTDTWAHKEQAIKATERIATRMDCIKRILQVLVHLHRLASDSPDPATTVFDLDKEADLQLHVSRTSILMLRYYSTYGKDFEAFVAQNIPNLDKLVSFFHIEHNLHLFHEN